MSDQNQNTNGEGYFKGNIDARVSNLEQNVDKMMTNHLPHLQLGIDKLAERLDGISTRLAMWALGIIASIFIAVVVSQIK